ARVGARTDCDLCVVGGGVAGICTAVAAARLGLSVALVHDRPVLGGNNSSEVRVHLGAYQNLPPYPRLGDVLAEFGPREGGNAREESVYEDERKLAVVRGERNIRLFLDTRMRDVATNETGAITRVYAVNTRDGRYEIITAALFADCTGDGNLGFAAGADFRMGREARGETNEPGAPEASNMTTMGASVQWYAGDAAGDADFPVREWMLKTFTDENCSPHMRGDWWWETGLGRDQIAEGEYIRDYGLLVAFSNWAYVKNCFSKRADFRDKELKWVAYNAGRRESRRLLGDFVLDQNHLRSRDLQRDGTCAATWTIDLHLPKSEAESKFRGEPFQANSLQEKIWPYPIPYRCLYSRNVPNLFMAGRDISVTHIALGTTRLMRTHGMMGEVVGMAAAVCKRHGCAPRDVYTTYLDELKELMSKGVGDGKPHPRQDYNCASSLDPDIRAEYVRGSRVQ
ncbi:MAG: FAD-dependent oxidoreductase, partial [Kiritimatiellae bacterium]|nr:FAD-dependent oxidoreductase [Kiritimatiellia bacterium]